MSDDTKTSHEDETEEIVDTAAQDELDAIWYLSLRDVPLTVWFSVAAIVSAVVGGAFVWLTNNTVESWNKRMESVEGQIGRLDTNINDRLDSIAVRVEQATRAEIDVTNDMSEIRERLASIEATVALSNDILFQADRASIERQFLPILSRAPNEFFIGGGDGEAKVAEGFEDMVLTVPFPRTLSERDDAIALLTGTHRRLLEAQNQPKFDEDRLELEVSARQVLLTDGTIQLELTSRVIEIPR